ncbi:unnamed protein product [Ectocarpus sp. CCAP 1310/34]|nr:unnamed protein product [Ectocarpus sp. CCAP 1310/34]
MSSLFNGGREAPSVSAGITVNVAELVEAFPNYQEPDRVQRDVLELSKSCKTLVPKRGSVDLESGRAELLTLHGTFPMVFRDAQYFTPVQIYITESYPASPPVCYIIPTPGMSLRAGHQSVDETGLVSLPYLQGWSAAHNLVELVGTMSTVFGAQPPLFATPSPSSSTPTKTTKASGASGKQGTLQVVCPNYGRTGTKSMKAALEILGFGPCYHMVSLVGSHLKNHPQASGALWVDGFQGRGLDVNKILDGYKAVVDWPAASFYKEVLQSNPHAKVIMTVRDPDAWWNSMVASIHTMNPVLGGWGIFFLEVLKSDVRLYKHMLGYIKTHTMEEDEAKADYVRHNKEVLAHVGADKGRELLEFSVEQGWGPLCKFLDVPVPDVPFPNVDSREELKITLNRFNRHGWLIMAATVTVAGASVAAASFFGGKRAGGALAATEALILTSRFRKALAVRRID